jgi:hypothetical protein
MHEITGSSIEIQGQVSIKANIIDMSHLVKQGDLALWCSHIHMLSGQGICSLLVPLYTVICSHQSPLNSVVGLHEPELAKAELSKPIILACCI